jgi:hypothetical protein
MIIIEVVRVLLIEMMLMSTHGESDRLQIMGIRQFANFCTGANQACFAQEIKITKNFKSAAGARPSVNGFYFP